MTLLLPSLLLRLTWPEWRHHPWRHAAALFAVTLGVALGFSVQLINQSALAEFGSALRAVGGVPDFELRGQRSGFDEALYARVAIHPQVAVASPVVEIDTVALDVHGGRVPLKLIGLDALVAAPLAPALMPRPQDGADRFAMLDPDAVFLNATAQLKLGTASLRVETPNGLATLAVRGGVGAAGGALAVMDIAGAQSHFGWGGRLSRIDVRLRAGADRAAVLRELALPAGLRAAAPDEATQRISNVSRAYRVNLGVLALVALFTGAFLVFSILSLSVTQRQPQFALLGVLGLAARERLALVLLEAGLLGLLGSALGLLLGSALAALALRLLGGDLGSGYFAGSAPALHFDAVAAALYGLLGIGAALAGAWLPARAAQRLAPAQALKELVDNAARRTPRWLAPLLFGAAPLLALLPPIADMPLAAYAAVACLLLGGVASVPLLLGALLDRRRPPRHALALLAFERAHRQRQGASSAVAGVVASLALAVALTVMVASFRVSMLDWLDTVLPADLYARVAAAPLGADALTLAPALVDRARAIDGVARVQAQRVVPLQLAAARPAVVLLARTLSDPERALPLVGPLRTLPAGSRAVYVSEAMTSLYGAAPGSVLELPLGRDGAALPLFVRGVWRDYARQHGTIAIDAADYQALTGDVRVNDLALWLRPGADPTAVERALRAASSALGVDGALLELGSAAAIRAMSLRVFDRSFAVTYWLQAVAIAIGLFGIAASTSAQVLARRKEFALLAHIGLTRRQLLIVLAAESALWNAVGALLGLLLGLAVSVVLVKVVNPQSFHWSMNLALPWPRLLLLCAAVLACGVGTAWLAARRSVGRDMLQAVRDDT